MKHKKVSDIQELKYEKHQRDYTLLGTSLVFRAYFDNKAVGYFDHTPHPMYVTIEDGILYHFTASEDSVNRAKKWVENYTASDLQKHKDGHDKVLEEYRNFLKNYTNEESLDSIKKLHEYFFKLLPLILVAIEVPEYTKDDIDDQVFKLCMEIRKENEDVYKVGFDAQKNLLEIIEKKEDVKAGYLKFLTYEEFERFLETKTLPENISQRKDFFLVKESFEGTKTFTEIEKLNDFGLVSSIDENIKEFSGSIAYKGRVKGRVRLIKLVKDAEKIEEGDVLVTSMTDPRYVPYMKKASAIVTDEGGITCHAAIVSRELKKPCVIGTKFATQVLKDGMEVEVDADNGVVRIL